MHKIMIVEDDEIVAKLYANSFREEGFEAETQSDGAAALERITLWRPDAILLDLDLPLVHGLEVIKRIRLQEEFWTLPIVVLSNAYQHNSIEQAWKAGASMCLIKAKSVPAQVVAAVREAITNPLPQPIAVTSSPRVEVKPMTSFNLEADPAFRAEILAVFSQQTAQSLAEMRLVWLHLVGEKSRVQAPVSDWHRLGRKVHALTGNAAVVGFRQFADLSSALEILLQELCQRPSGINSSTLRTVGETIVFLASLLEWVGKEWPVPSAVPRILVVDDELFARKAAEAALELVNGTATFVDNAEAALRLLHQDRFDLILLDVDMPGMTGFELRELLPTFPTQKETPVIFVTGVRNFEDRADSTLRSGDDLIGKPYLLMELTVKALTSILRSQASQFGAARTSDQFERLDYAGSARLAGVGGSAS